MLVKLYVSSVDAFDRNADWIVEFGGNGDVRVDNAADDGGADGAVRLGKAEDRNEMMEGCFPSAGMSYVQMR